MEGALIVCPPFGSGFTVARSSNPYSLAIASGWMALRAYAKKKRADRGLHYPIMRLAGIKQAVKETGAEQVFVNHGYCRSVFEVVARSGAGCARGENAV